MASEPLAPVPTQAHRWRILVQVVRLGDSSLLFPGDFKSTVLSTREPEFAVSLDSKREKNCKSNGPMRTCYVVENALCQGILKVHLRVTFSSPSKCHAQCNPPLIRLRVATMPGYR